METVYNVLFYGGLTLAIIFAIVAVILFFVLKIPKAIGDVTGSTARKKIEEIRQKGYESVQGGGVSKQEAIKSHTSRISVRDIQNTASEKQAEKGKANYERAVAAIADLDERRREDATDVLHEDMHEMSQQSYAGDEDATDIIFAPHPNTKEAADMVRGAFGQNIGGDIPESEMATDVLRSDDDLGESATDVLRSDDDLGESATDVLRSDMREEDATDVLREEYEEDATDVLRDESDEDATDVLHGGRSSTVKVLKSVIVVHTDEKI